MGNHVHGGAASRSMNLFCVGLSHHTADVATREHFAGNATAESIARQAGCAEALLLTTCNRVEVYGVSNKGISTDEIARCLVAETNRDPDNYAPAFYRYEDNKCVQHLFRVASGLDSMVVGESEIFGQAKKAYESARTSGAVGPYLHRLFQRAFRVAKQVRTHTDRSLDRARELAQAVGGRAVPFQDWAAQCREIDILLTSTASEAPLLTCEILAPMLWQRLDRSLFIIDIGVPRDVDPRVNELQGVYLYDIDSIRSVADQSLELRRQQVAAAEAIIADHVTEFVDAISRGLNGAAQAPEHSSLGENSLRASEL
jgi:glutamyl-tRNA reductase